MDVLLRIARRPPPFWSIVAVLVAVEALFSAAIVLKVPYTEIDWVAYMQEVEGFLDGERDYTKLKGDTGPLVYPAGFVYVFSLLRMVTSNGRDIRAAQWIFAGLNVATLVVVLLLYRRSTKFPWPALAILVLSKRIHSIFVLRLFNDPIALLPLHMCTYFLINGNTFLAATFFSLALSIKMNVLLFAPGFALVVLQQCTAYAQAEDGRLPGIVRAAGLAIWTTLLQAFLAAPFLAAHPAEYILRAFEFSRAFEWKWTVNWRFLGPVVFGSPLFHRVLLGLHIALLLVFATRSWVREGVLGLLKILRDSLAVSSHGNKNAGRSTMSADYIMRVMYTSNLIGIVCARSLHYQFYAWYFHMLPYLAWRTRLPTLFKLAALIAIEFGFNTYPSTELSSVVLFCGNSLILGFLLVGDGEDTYTKAGKAE
ncbi:dolichyl-P-Man:Man(5)GlcNAc(2)-PP-dolichyl mannosyltransferase [Zopfochytrium polystomum]|nr:dolichyl-P-Man:Man(5)GlcNAc(2)-PP-dolichyl mannosyltransferase [Zopfochytrium polystomum]